MRFAGGQEDGSAADPLSSLAETSDGSQGTLPVMGEQPSLNEWVCLALLVEGPAHGFALAKELEPGSDIGRILTVRRPLVYRAIDRMVVAKFIEPDRVEPGASGPNRTVHQVTDDGRGAVDRWLQTPVQHVRDLRVEFLLKLRLRERRGLGTRRLVNRQRSVLGPTLAELSKRGSAAGSGGGKSGGGGPDVVDVWRAHNAGAVSDFLDGVAQR